MTVYVEAAIGLADGDTIFLVYFASVDRPSAWQDNLVKVANSVVVIVGYKRTGLLASRTSPSSPAAP